MSYVFTALQAEYTSLLVGATITRDAAVQAAAEKLLKLIDAGNYDAACAASGVPKIVAAASFEREASSNFRLSPAQGDPWDQVSKDVPRGIGPFPNWTAAAIKAYQIDGLDKIGSTNWSWERSCYEEELFNGFGYRQFGIHTPYLWAGTNLYLRGKYGSDGRFSAGLVDPQLGVIPMMMRMVELRPDLALPQPFPVALPSIPAPPIVPSLPPDDLHEATTLQTDLNKLGIDPQLIVNGNYDRFTKAAVTAFQTFAGITVDGLAGPETWAEITKRLP